MGEEQKDLKSSSLAVKISATDRELRKRDGFSYRALIETSEGLGFNVNLVSVDGRHNRAAIKDATRNYFVVKGTGFFTLDGEKHPISEGDLFVIPDGHDYEYEGQMQLFEFNVPGTTRVNEINLDEQPT